MSARTPEHPLVKASVAVNHKLHVFLGEFEGWPTLLQWESLELFVDRNLPPKAQAKQRLFADIRSLDDLVDAGAADNCSTIERLRFTSLLSRSISDIVKYLSTTLQTLNARILTLLSKASTSRGSQVAVKVRLLIGVALMVVETGVGALTGLILALGTDVEDLKPLAAARNLFGTVLAACEAYAPFAARDNYPTLVHNCIATCWKHARTYVCVIHTTLKKYNAGAEAGAEVDVVATLDTPSLWKFLKDSTKLVDEVATPAAMSDFNLFLSFMMEVEYRLPQNSHGLTSCLDIEFAMRLLKWEAPLWMLSPALAQGGDNTTIPEVLQQVTVMLFMMHDTWIPLQGPPASVLQLHDILLRYVDRCLNFFKQWFGLTFEGKADPRAANSPALGYCVALGAAIVGMVLTCVKQGVFELAPTEDAVLRLLCLVSEGALIIMAESKAAGNSVLFDSGQPKWWDKLWPLFVQTMLENPCKFDFAVLGPAVEGVYRVAGASVYWISAHPTSAAAAAATTMLTHLAPLPCSVTVPLILRFPAHNSLETSADIKTALDLVLTVHKVVKEITVGVTAAPGPVAGFWEGCPLKAAARFAGIVLLRLMWAVLHRIKMDVKAMGAKTLAVKDAARINTMEVTTLDTALLLIGFTQRTHLLERSALSAGEMIQFTGIAMLINAWEPFQFCFFNSELPIPLEDFEAGAAALHMLLSHDAAFTALATVTAGGYWVRWLSSNTLMGEDRAPDRLAFMSLTLRQLGRWYIRHLTIGTAGVNALKEPMHQLLNAALTTMKKDRILDEGFITQAPHQSDAQYWADVLGRLDLALTQAKTHEEMVTQAVPVVNPQRTSLTSRYRRCANAACSNLTGYSERRTKSKTCSSCGVARYCSVACQTVHWKAGHRDECSWLLTVRESE